MPKNHDIFHKQPIYQSTSFTNLSNDVELSKLNSNFYLIKNTMYRESRVCNKIVKG